MADIGYSWPVLLGGPTHWTVGLVATLLSISSIIAADTFAFLGGKVSSDFEIDWLMQIGLYDDTDFILELETSLGL